MSEVPTEPVAEPRRGRSPGPLRPGPGPMVLRIAIIAVGLTIGVVLMARGDWVLGGLLLLFAGLRLVATVTMHRRRREWRAPFESRRAARRAF